MIVNLGTAGKRSDLWLWESGCCKSFKAESATLASPTVNPVTDKDTVISGKVSSAIAGGTVVVSNEQGFIGKGAVDSNYNFSVTIPAQTAGTTLSVQVFDSQNNYSEPTVVVVGSSVTFTAPIVNEITDHSKTITGTIRPNVLVTAKAGKRAFRAYANSSG